MLTLDDPEQVNARDSPSAGNVNRVNRAVGLGDPGVDLGTEAELAQEPATWCWYCSQSFTVGP
jgi:hypothetical protein